MSSKPSSAVASSSEGSGRPPEPARRRSKPLEWWATRTLIRTLNLVGRVTPRSALAPMGRCLGMAAYHGMRRYRTVALANLRRAYGQEWDERKIEAVARESFRHLGVTLVEFFLRQPGISAEDALREVRFDGEEHYAEVLRRGKGGILVTAHYGNWEMMGPRLALTGMKISGISRTADDPGLEQMITSIRTRTGFTNIPRREAPRKGLATLRRNEILAVLLDQNTLEGGLFVPFFGYPASTASGPARFALQTGAALLPTFCIREADGTHVMRAWPPIYPEATGDKTADVYRLTAEVTRVIELQIRERPELWCWLHNRWKLQPSASEMAQWAEVHGFPEKGQFECNPCE